MQVTHITKGHAITNTETGRVYNVLSKTPAPNGTEDDYGTPNYATMVRPAPGQDRRLGRAFDLIISQALLDMGVYAVTKAAN